MSLALILYLVAVSGLVTAAAHLVEKAVGSVGPGRGRPGRRFVWFAAIVATVALTLTAPGRSMTLGPVEVTAARAQPAILQLPAAETTPAASLLELSIPSAVSEVLQARRSWIGPVALAASAGMLLLILGAALRLELVRRRLPRALLLSRQVRLSDRLGPALMGLIRPDIVMPRELARLDVDRLEMILRHEAEHRRAMDPALLFLGALGLAVMPWNPFGWLQFLRLRQAVETDCDARVLDSGVPVAPYARLLVAIRSNATPLSPLAPAIRESGSHLERRLQTMKQRFDRPSPLRAGGLAGLALILAVAACDAPTPAAIDAPEVAETKVPPPPPVEIGENDQPLIVVDGVITDGSLAEISALDIESIEVVKGSAARELYGSRAANGVVNITTKGERHPEGDEITIPHGEIRLHEQGTATFELKDGSKADGGVLKLRQLPSPPTPGGEGDDVELRIF